MSTLTATQEQSFAHTRESLLEEIGQSPELREEIIYPGSDGKPMADNTKQFEWIVLIKEGLELLFADDPDVFIAGDLLWYPVEGDNKTRVAPDVLAAFGRPKGHRGSYRTWDEGNFDPQVVFEILSPGNTRKEMAEKLKFYDLYGVEEYYLYDPDTIELNGWIRTGIGLAAIETMPGWRSPRLGIRFEIFEENLHLFRPDGEEILSPVEIGKNLQAARQDVTAAEHHANEAEQRAVAAEQQAFADRQRAVAAEQQALADRQRAEKLAAKLRELGIDVE